MTMQVGFVPRGRNILTISVTSYQDYCLKGFITTNQEEGALAFASTIDLLLLADDLMDAVNTPQRSEEQRSFAAIGGFVPAHKGRAEELPKEPPLATFQMNIMFRQNATWQGSLMWVETGQEARFRSVLELIRLLHSALTATEDE